MIAADVGVDLSDPQNCHMVAVVVVLVTVMIAVSVLVKYVAVVKFGDLNDLSVFVLLHPGVHPHQLQSMDHTAAVLPPS